MNSPIKKTLFVLMLLLLTGSSQAQRGMWTSRASFPDIRAYGVSFSIGTKAYFGTGWNGGSTRDFWEYDPTTNAWTQKANFGGVARYGAFGFATSSKGYIGAGWDSYNYFSDFWEYNPANNTWTQKAAFAGGARAAVISFAIGSKGYACGGANSSGQTNAFWEYDPANNAWTSKANFGGGSRGAAATFVINSKGYVVCGNNNGNLAKDLWAYDPGTNTWAQKADFGGAARQDAIAFSIGTHAYAGSGSTQANSWADDFWEYNATTNTWFPAAGIAQFTGRNGSSAVSIGNRGYLITGFTGSSYGTDLLMFNPDTIIPAQPKSVIPSLRSDATAFTIGSKGYVGTGYNGANYLNDFWEYNPALDVWTQKANVPGGTRSRAAGFSIGTKGYMGTGYDGSVRKNDFYEYNPATNTWTQKANFAGGVRNSSASFNIGTKGYICGGFDGSVRSNDLWEYNPANDTWTQKTSFGGTGRSALWGLAINGKGYIGGGWDATNYFTDFWEYNPGTNTWASRATIPGSGSYAAVAFNIGNKGYVCTGYDQNSMFITGMQEYNTLTNTWTQVLTFPGTVRSGAIAFAANNKGYVGTGNYNSRYLDDLWEFDFQPVSITNVSPAVICPGDSLLIRFKLRRSVSTLNFQLSNGSGSFTSPVTLATKSDSVGNDSIKIIIPPGTASGSAYSIRIVSSAGDTSIASAPFTISGPVVTLTANKPGFCPGDSVTLTAATGSGYSYQWLSNNTLINGITTSTYTVKAGGNYRVVISTSAYCRDSSSAVAVAANPKPVAGFTINNAAQCLSGNSFVFTNTSTITSGFISSWWNLGTGAADTSVQTNTSKTYNTTGTYTVRFVSTSDKGCVDSTSKTAVVNASPKTGFTINTPAQQCLSGNSFSFTDTTASASQHKWNLGTGPADTTSLLTVTKTYGTAGTFVVKLVATNNNGCKDSVAQNVTVNPQPVAAFSTDSAQCVNGNSFVMNNSSTGSPVSYAWNFGNSTSSAQLNPSVSYASAGFYTIRLKATNNSNCSDSVQHVVHVKPNPPVPLVVAFPDTIACSNVSIMLRTNAPEAKTWLLNGNPTGSTADSLLVNNASGVYALRVTNTFACTASSSQVNLLFKPAPPKPTISVSGNILTSSASTGNQWYGPSGMLSGQTGPILQVSQSGLYYTIVTINGCSSPASDPVNFTGVYVGKVNSELNAEVYPNPNSGSFTIQLQKPGSEKITVRLLDMSGKEISKQVFEPAAELHTLIEHVANGTYLLLLQTDEMLQRMPVVISR